MIRDTDAVDYYVTFDSVAVGEAWGDYLISKATGKGKILMLIRRQGMSRFVIVRPEN